MFSIAHIFSLQDEWIIEVCLINCLLVKDNQLISEPFLLEKLQKKPKKYEQNLKDDEEIIRSLTAQLDACQTREEARRGNRNRNENAPYLGESGCTPLPQVRFIRPYHPVDEIWQLEQHRGDGSWLSWRGLEFSSWICIVLWNITGYKRIELDNFR